jgi:hypothetical protein
MPRFISFHKDPELPDAIVEANWQLQAARAENTTDALMAWAAVQQVQVLEQIATTLENIETQLRTP